MKILVTLSVLQTLGIALIAFLLIRDPAPHQFAQVPVAAAESPALVRADAAAPQVRDSHIRELIRSEIAVAKSPAQNATPAPARDVQSELRQRETVAQQIEMYRGIGAIDDAQMTELQEQIATLDDDGRKQVMSKLMRAMNAGEIKGRF